MHAGNHNRAYSHVNGQRKPASKIDLTSAIAPPKVFAMRCCLRSPIARSITAIVTVFFILQTALIAVTASILGLWGRLVTGLMLGVSVGYYCVLLALLLRKRDDFRLVDPETPLTRVNFSNLLTVDRNASLPAALSPILLARDRPLLTSWSPSSLSFSSRTCWTA